ncbi:MAG TPA: hypothetical protein VGZ22_19645 [Isosphaeraceae bacterium]|nr:hypothetical protein [Isosphaeraceae bacterium]
MGQVGTYNQLSVDKKILIEISLYTLFHRTPYSESTLAPGASEDEKQEFLRELTARNDAAAQDNVLLGAKIAGIREVTARNAMFVQPGVGVAGRPAMRPAMGPEWAKRVQEIQKHLFQAYDEGKFPHRLHECVFLREYVYVDPEGRSHPQPGELVPVECVMVPEGQVVPSLKIDREQQETFRVRAIEAFEPILAQGGTMQVATAVIDGVECEVWPFVPEKKKSIPRKKIAQKAFVGYKAATPSQGFLELTKETADGYQIECSFDFGTWRRTVLGSLRVRRDGVKVLGTPLVYWSTGHGPNAMRDIPILTEEIFRKTMENAAFAASEVERVFLPELAGELGP